MANPDHDDVVVASGADHGSTGYLLGTVSAPGQLMLPTRDEVVSHATSYAKHQHVRAWYCNVDGSFVLLATFREEPRPSIAASTDKINFAGSARPSPKTP